MIAAMRATQAGDAVEDRIDADGPLEVSYSTMETPIGSLLLAATPRGLVRVAFAGESEEEALSEVSERVSARVRLAPAKLDAAARELDEYFAGRRRSFEVPLDMRLARGFRRTVLESMSQIDYGSTVSYAALAAAAGSPRAVRAVGSACATNPLPVVLPCHRVLRSDGSLGGYGGGLEAKRALLDLEAG